MSSQFLYNTAAACLSGVLIGKYLASRIINSTEKFKKEVEAEQKLERRQMLEDEYEKKGYLFDPVTENVTIPWAKIPEEYRPILTPLIRASKKRNF